MSRQQSIFSQCVWRVRTLFQVAEYLNPVQAWPLTHTAPLLTTPVASPRWQPWVRTSVPALTPWTLLVTPPPPLARASALDPPPWCPWPSSVPTSPVPTSLSQTPPSSTPRQPLPSTTHFSSTSPPPSPSAAQSSAQIGFLPSEDAMQLNQLLALIVALVLLDMTHGSAFCSMMKYVVFA